jgi:hypothetical protein
MNREILQQSLDVLKSVVSSHGRILTSNPPQDAWTFNNVDQRCNDAITALEAELAKPINELNQWGECEQIEYGSDGCNDPAVTPLYTSPPRKEWVGLTEVDCDKAWEHAQKSSRYGVTRIGVFAKTIETKLKEKNCTHQD